MWPAGRQSSLCPVACTFGPFRLPPGHPVPRCQHFGPISLASRSPCTPLPALLAFFAGSQDAMNRGASTFGGFCWRAGRRFRVKPGMRGRRGHPVPRCLHFRRFLLSGRTRRTAGQALLAFFAGSRDSRDPGRAAEILGQARNEGEGGPAPRCLHFWPFLLAPRTR